MLTPVTFQILSTCPGIPISTPNTHTVQVDTYGYLQPTGVPETVSEDQAGYLIPSQGTPGVKLTFENSDCDSSEVIASLYSGINDQVEKDRLEIISERHDDVSISSAHFVLNSIH